MKQFYFITITTLFVFFSCQQESKTLENSEIEQDSINIETKDEKQEIENASSLNIKETNAFFNSSIPADGELDDPYDEEMITKSEKKKVKNNKIFWCYDVQELTKIEFIGSAENINIYFNNEVIVEKLTFTTKYNLPIEKIGTSGVIELRGDGKVLQTLKIEYEGCL